MTKRGQSSVELAVFGSIFIFCLGMLISYGMMYNFTQHHQINSFHKTLEKAREVAFTQLYATQMVISDKFLPNPQDPWGIEGTKPFISINSLTVSNELTTTPTYGDPSHIPRIYFEINGRQLENPYPDRPTLIGSDKKGLTVAGWAEYSLEELPTEITRKVTDLKDQYDIDGNPGPDGIYWRYLTVDLSDPYVNEDGQLCDASGKVVKFAGDDEEGEIALSEGMSVDINGNGAEEHIVELVRGAYRAYWGSGAWELAGIKCIDFTKGDIDNTIDTEGMPIDERPGLIPGQEKFTIYDKRLTTTAEKGKYRSRESGSYTERIIRRINIQDPQQQPVQLGVSSWPAKTFDTTWETE